jgi:hypothetical protein
MERAMVSAKQCGGGVDVLLTGHVVAVEHGAGLVAAHGHRDALTDTSSDEVPNGRPAEIVK